MNNRGLNNLFIFAAGAIAGSVATWYITKRYFKKIADEEIESVKETFSRLNHGEDLSDVEECEFEDIEVITSNTNKKPDLMEYAAILKEQGYTNYADGGKPGKPDEEVKNMKRPYVIDPSDFGDNDYETVSLNYYADGVLTDDQDEIIENVDEVVGVESLNHFGEYEDDSVFVRNDERQIDYEILKDYRNYSDVVGED